MKKKSDEKKSPKEESTNPNDSSDINGSQGVSEDQSNSGNGLNNLNGYTPFAIPFMHPPSSSSFSNTQSSHANRYGIMPTLNTWWPVMLAGVAAMSGLFSRSSSSSTAVEQPTVSTEISVPEVSRINNMLFWSPSMEAGVLFAIALRYYLFNSAQSLEMSQLDIAEAEGYQSTNYYSALSLIPVVITGAFFLETLSCNYAFGRRPNNDDHHDPIYHSIIQGAGRVGPGIVAVGHTVLSFAGSFILGNKERAEVVTEVLSDLTVAANIAGRVIVINDRIYDRYMDISPDLDGYVPRIGHYGMIVTGYITYLVETLASAGFFIMDLGVTSVVGIPIISTNEQTRLYVHASTLTAADVLEGLLIASVDTQVYYLTRLAQIKIIADMLTKAGIDPFTMVKGVEPRKIDKLERSVGGVVNDLMDALGDTADTVKEALHLHTVPRVTVEKIASAIEIIHQAINTFEARLNLSEDIPEAAIIEAMNYLKGEVIASLEATLTHTDGEHVDLNIDAYIAGLNSAMNSILVGGSTNIQSLQGAIDTAAVQMRDAVRHGVIHNVVEDIENAVDDVQDALRLHNVPRVPAEEIGQEIAVIHRAINAFETALSNTVEVTPDAITIATEPLQGVVIRGLETTLSQTNGEQVDANIIAYIAGLNAALDSITIGGDIQTLREEIEASGERMQDAVRHGAIENIGDVMEDVGDVLHLNATPQVPIEEINQVIDSVHQAIAEFETALVNQEVNPEAIAVAMAPFQGAIITGLEDALRNTDGEQLDENITAYIRGIRAIIGEIKVGSLESRQALVKIVKAGGVTLHEAANHGVVDDIADAFDDVGDAIEEATHHAVHGIRGHTHEVLEDIRGGTHHLLQDIRHSAFGRVFHLKDKPNEEEKKLAEDQRHDHHDDELPGSHPDDHGGDHGDA